MGQRQRCLAGPASECPAYGAKQRGSSFPYQDRVFHKNRLVDNVFAGAIEDQDGLFEAVRLWILCLIFMSSTKVI